MKVPNYIKTSLFARVFVLLVPLFCHAQGPSAVEMPISFGSSALYYFPTGFGISAGLQRPIRQTVRLRHVRNVSDAVLSRTAFLGLTSFYYRYPKNNSGVCAMVEAGWQYAKKDWFTTSLSAGLGLLRTFYIGDVFQVNADGTVKRLPFFGRFYAMGQLSYALNWALSRKTKEAPVLRLKPSLQFQFPYNSFLKPNLVLEAGVFFTIRRIKVPSTLKSHKS